tara:strand:+ start:355 stop:831 length:477 start_codon:yes stop_codon:yes gene_type:complete
MITFGTKRKAELKYTTSGEIESILRAAIPNPLLVIAPSVHADGVYAMATHHWYVRKGFPAYKRWSILQGLWKWFDRHDCDDKADVFKVFMQRCFRGAKAADCDGFAVFRIFYHIGGERTKGHAINLVITDHGVEFVEPQTARFVTLTQAELESIWTVY